MIEKITGQYGPDAVAKARGRKGHRTGEAGSGADEASFSSFAVELSYVAGELKNVPEVRQDLIDDLKKKVEAGEYHPPLEKIAHNLFMAGILDDGK
ncbi:MAG: flagellar biosynthesis anti-sigma factor FlgM [Synergistaceae bacterium]|nr:flagellar biosynthesis anti-sigma factor FlgM [Synergistaceae bacterium]